MANAKPKILLVEDDNDQVMMYDIALRRAGLSVYFARTGKEGIIKALKYKPDLILLDLVLPDITGQETLAELKKLQATKDIKVAILSNLSKHEVIDECYKLGAESFLAKMQLLPREVAAKVWAMINKKPA